MKIARLGQLHGLDVVKTYVLNWGGFVRSRGTSHSLRQGKKYSVLLLLKATLLFVNKHAQSLEKLKLASKAQSKLFTNDEEYIKLFFPN